MKNNIANNFEDVYLRSNILKRAVNTLSDERIKEIFEDTHFKRCVKYIATNTFRKNSSFFTQHGFMWEDIWAIGKIFGLSFYSDGKTYNSKQDESYLLMRYLNQRFQRFCIWSHKKFGAQEKISESTVDESVWFYVMPSTAEDAMSLDEKIGQKADQLYEINRRSQLIFDEEARSNQDCKYILRKQKNKAIVRSKPLQDDLSKLSAERSKEKSVSDRLTKKLKKSLDKNWRKHKTQLAYYATSKYVAYDVRKKARKFCSKYGIDYVKWGQEQIDKGIMDSNELSMG